MGSFPEEFVWGVSTSAYQIEGAAREDGRGESIWDTFSREEDRVAGGDTGDVACDHYHRYGSDIEVLKQLGVDAYRFSVSWPRVLPEGKGRVNRKGLDFYDRLVDGLLEAGVAPWVCLYHWDLPQALEDSGGWLDRDTAWYFADYAETVADSLGDRVDRFLLMNEPNVHALLGYLLGIHAPGRHSIGEFAAAAHHLNLATGLGYERLRHMGDWQLSTILNLEPVHAGREGDEHEEVSSLFDAFRNRVCLDPLLKGEYPAQLAPMLEAVVRDGDMQQIRREMDFLGLNLYGRSRVILDPGSLVGVRELGPPEGAQRTHMGWEVYPQAMYEQLLELRDKYGNPPVVITENGAAFEDRPDATGNVEDAERTAYLAAYLEQVARAREAGADVRGYFAWTLLDNFEWAEGYGKRFGLVRVDFETQERIPKASFHWYRETIARNEPVAGSRG